MPAAATDLLKKYKSLFSTTLSVGIGTGTSDTITPASVSGLPTDTLITLTFDRVDSGGVATPTKLERIQGIISGGNFTSYTRGIDGTTEQAHAGGAVIEMIWNADDWNDLVTWGLTEHNQLGGHTNITASNITASATTSSLHYKVQAAGDLIDANGNELLKFTQTASAVNEFTIGNSVTGSDVTLTATGGDAAVSINLVSKGAGTVKVNGTTITSGSTAATRAEVATGTSNTLMATPQNLHEFHVPPQGFLYNGKIVPSVASNNLTVALKGLDGNDPSATNPVYVRIGDTVRSITAALSVTKNAGTNYHNAGGAEIATKEADYFVYLGYNATDGVVIGFSRIPGASIYSDFSATYNDNKFASISTITNAAAGDTYELIGRFAATMSAGAGYTWSVPTFNAINLIQRPIYETRFLTYTPTLTWTAGVAPSGSPGINTHNYKITYKNMHVSNFVDGYTAGTTVTRVQISTPILPSGYFVNSGQITVSDTPNSTTGYVASGGVMNLFCTSASITRFTNTALFSI